MSKNIFIWLNEHFNLLKEVSILLRMNSQWTPCKSASDNARIEDLKLIFTEAKDRLKETVDSFEKYYQRSVSIILLSITLLTSSLAFLSSKLSTFKLTVLNMIVMAITIILIIILVKLKDNIIPQTFYVGGTDPKKIFVDDFFTDLPEEKNSEWMLQYNLVRDYQNRIDENGISNANRAKKIKDSIRCLYWIPVSVIVTSIIGAIFHLPFLM